MKQSLILSICLLIAVQSFGQKFEALDKSPMDMVYFPNNFSHDRKFDPKKIGDLPAIIRVIYSRPAKNKRVIFGKVVPYNEVWRTGANEATEIKFYKDVTLDGKLVPAGTYTLFTIPNTTEWTIIISKDLDHWGEYSYNQANDVLRMKVPAKKLSKAIENFSMKFETGKEREAIMVMGWDDTLVEVPISF